MTYEDTYLAHYGVKGMKWGVRRNPEKAYAKATRKKDRLIAKAKKHSLRSEYLSGQWQGIRQRTVDRYNRASSIGQAWMDLRMTNQSKINRVYAASVREDKKMKKYMAKATKWMESMTSVFADYKVFDAPQTRSQKKAKTQELTKMMEQMQREEASAFWKGYSDGVTGKKRKS